MYKNTQEKIRRVKEQKKYIEKLENEFFIFSHSFVFTMNQQWTYNIAENIASKKWKNGCGER
jgi:hypothetical protein